MRKRKICVVTGTRAEYGLAKWVWGILNWAIINGEEKFGVTVHYVDEGIDTGDSTLRVLRVLDVVTREEIPVRGLRIGMRFTSGTGVLGEDMKDKAVIVIGAGGHAKVLLDTLLERGVKVVGFLEKDGRAGGGKDMAIR